MTTVELFAKEQCPLCEEARAILARVQTEMPFTLVERHLEPGTEEERLYRDEIPVVHINGRRAFTTRIDETAFRRILREDNPPERQGSGAGFFAAKGLEALGIACVMIGLVQGIASETMWMELYLSIAGIGLFLVGRFIERRPDRTRKNVDNRPPAGQHHT